MSNIIVISIIIIFIIIVFISIYNLIISIKNRVIENKSSIDVFLQNRLELIPNLVETVKQYMFYEKKVLEEVTKLRTEILAHQEIDGKRAQMEETLSGMLKNLFAVSENYPNLKSDTTFLNLQREWTEIESNIAAARRSYNSAVKDLKDKQEQIPFNIVAKMMNIENYEMFEADSQAGEKLDAKKLFNS